MFSKLASRSLLLPRAYNSRVLNSSHLLCSSIMCIFVSLLSCFVVFGLLVWRSLFATLTPASFPCHWLKCLWYYFRMCRAEYLCAANFTSLSYALLCPLYTHVTLISASFYLGHCRRIWKKESNGWFAHNIWRIGITTKKKVWHQWEFCWKDENKYIWEYRIKFSWKTGNLQVGIKKMI